MALGAGVFFGQPALGQQQPNEVVRDTHGAWEIRCVEGEGTCVMAQAGKGPTGSDILEMRIRKLDGVTTEDGKTVPAAIQIAAPLGVLLRAGVQMRIDGNEPRVAPFEICIPNPAACLVRDLLSEELIGQMRAGNAAKLTLVSPTRGEVAVDISLSGFTRAYRSLEP